jgi:hypothetical protein
MQQIPFIDLFKSALHISGDKFAHPQEHFLLYIQLLVHANAHKVIAGFFLSPDPEVT